MNHHTETAITPEQADFHPERLYPYRPEWFFPVRLVVSSPQSTGFFQSTESTGHCGPVIQWVQQLPSGYLLHSHGIDGP